MDLKDFLKAIKLNEGTVSMILGALVVGIVGLLIINYFRDIRTTQSVSPSISEKSATTESTKLPTTHAVAQGENLWQIAEKYYGSGYNWVDIAKENKLANANQLLVGQSINLPKVETRLVKDTQQSVSTTLASANTTSSISGDSYAVVKGDHLWGISVRAYGDGYQWTKIAQANNLTNPNLIYPNTQLKLPR